MATLAPHHSQHGTHGSLSFDLLSEPMAIPTKPCEIHSASSTSPRTPTFPADLSTTSGPLPNPPFVFPARQASSSAPSSFSRASGRRPQSAVELTTPGPGYSSIANFQAKSVPAPLPSFSFKPSEPVSIDSGMSMSPQFPDSPSGRLNPSRSSHRRGGSEFIGGDGKSGAGTILVSSSPPNADGGVESPSAPSSLGPSTGRRGHAHRRSAAISCHDLSMILKPPPGISSGGSSAPASPSLNGVQGFSFPASPASPRHGLTTSISDPIHSFKMPTLDQPESPKPGQARARVGFSDTLEFIPRPLSLVSSDCSSTATVRPGHSVSGSLSSIVSSGAVSPPTKEPSGLSSPAHATSGTESRPSTAGAILGMTCSTGDDTVSHRRRSSLPGVEDLSSTSPSATSGSKSLKNYFFGNSETGSSSPTRSRPVSSAGSDRKSNSSAPNSPGVDATNGATASVEEAVPAQRRPSLTRKPSKKQKKVKSWAGSILSRKSRPRGSKGKAMSRRSPTPPLRNYEPFESTVAQSSDPIIEEPSPQEAQSALTHLDTNFASWKPRHVAPPEDETMSPMIDLDAALGPFNTPTASSYDPEWEASQRGGRQPGKRRMHSGGLARSYRDPFHRRSESAPEMDNPRFLMHRLGSNSTMADVFEEDEEDDWEETKTVSHKSSKVQIDDEDIPAVSVVDSDSGSECHEMDWSASDAETQRGVKRKGSGLSEGERRQAMGGIAKSERSATSLKDEPIAEELESPVEILDEIALSHDDLDTRSSNSTVTPPLRPNNLAPVEIKACAVPKPFLTPASPNSSFPSPFPSPRSPMSYDAQRISTAPSSYTDENTFESLLLGEPGPEVRMSVDDVPSLTSSTSTMTRESLSHPALANPQFRTSQRSASLSAPYVQRKRSSIASLSRLLHSSHGEKSPLSTEVSAPATPERKEKTGRNRRLSRLMQFWKPKDSSSVS